MKKTPTIELLFEIDKYGINEVFNVSPFMAKHFPMPEPTQENPIPWDDKQESTAKHVLNQMKQQGFINFEMLEKTIFKFDFDENVKTISNKWFDNTDFYISFTLGAVNYLQQYKLNEALLENMEVQKRYSFLA